MITRQIFCAREQKITAHTVEVEPMNGEILATCPCGRFLKFPAKTTPEQFTDLIAQHEAANKGDVTVESMEALAAQLGDPVEDETEA